MNNASRWKERFLIIIVAILLIVMGVIIYLRYDSGNSSNLMVTDDYYTAEFLFNNDYIKVANKITDFNNDSDNLYMYLDGENVLHIKYKDREDEINKEITGLPEESATVYYSNIGSMCYELGALVGTDFYYTDFCLNKKVSSFEKISTSVEEVYVASVFKEGVYVVDNKDITSNFIVNTTMAEMKYLSYKDNVLGLYNDIYLAMPYFDYVCMDENDNFCKNLKIYLTFEDKLVTSYNLDNTIKNEDGEDIEVLDFFAVLKIDNSSRTDFDEFSYQDFVKEYNFVFTVYVLDKNNMLYAVTINNDVVKKQLDVNGIKVSSSKVKTIDYIKDENQIKEILITYENGKYNKIIENNNLDIAVSTIYDRDNN